MPGCAFMVGKDVFFMETVLMPFCEKAKLLEK